MKLNRFCRLIHRTRDLHSMNCWRSFYNSNAKSVITCGLLVYGWTTETSQLQNESDRRPIRQLMFSRLHFKTSKKLRQNQFLYSFWILCAESDPRIFKNQRNQLLTCAAPKEVNNTQLVRISPYFYHLKAAIQKLKWSWLKNLWEKDLTCCHVLISLLTKSLKWQYGRLINTWAYCVIYA